MPRRFSFEFKLRWTGLSWSYRTAIGQRQDNDRTAVITGVTSTLCIKARRKVEDFGNASANIAVSIIRVNVSGWVRKTLSLRR
jgi:hypothetical protein